MVINLKKKNIAIILQARCGSKRFPNKILKKIYKKNNSIDLIIKRLLNVFSNDSIIIATSQLKIDKKLSFLSRKYKVGFFSGSHNNLIKRYYDCAKLNKLKYLIRITADCPFVDPYMIKNFLKYFLKNNKSYSCNCAPYEKRTYPVGSDIEIFKFSELSKYKMINISKFQKEHISPFFLSNTNKKNLFNLKKDLSMIRYTLDYNEDLLLLKSLSSKLKNPFKARFNEIIKILIKNNEIASINSKYVQMYYKKKVKKGY